MELLIALLTGAYAAMVGGALWLSPRIGWLGHGLIGAAGGTLGWVIFTMAPTGVIAALAGGGDASYFMRLGAITGLCGLGSVWILGGLKRLLRG